MPVHFILFSLTSTIYPVLQLLTHFEKRQLLRCNLNLFAGFWVSSSVCLVFFDEKGTKTPDFNSIPFCQRIAHFIEKQGNDPFLRDVGS